MNVNYQYLIFDKYAGDITGNGDHRYDNAITSKISTIDFEDGSFTSFIDKEAIEFYNSKFNSKSQNTFILPDNLLESQLCKIKIYTKKIDGIYTIYTIIGINTLLLEKYIKSKNNILQLTFLKSLCRFNMNYEKTNKLLTNSFFYNNDEISKKIDQNTKYVIDKAMTAVDYTLDLRIQKLKELTIELYKYQKCSIYWMINRENEVEKNNTKIYYNLNDEIKIGNLYFDSYNQSLILADSRKSLIFRGGALIDEVGLGKTLQIISLAISNPAKDISYIRTNNNNKNFCSRATLILCPNQLCGQWLRELDSKLDKNNDYKIVSLLTKRDFDKITYQDLLDADFVVVSYTFLDNKIFTSEWVSKLSTLKSFHKKEWDNSSTQLVKKIFNDMTIELLSNPIQSLFLTHPLIQLIHWHRLVVDEFHEIQNAGLIYISNLLPFLTADYKWAVTATPFANRKSLNNITNFLTNYLNNNNNNENKNYDENIYIAEPIIEYLTTNCFRRNSKISIEQEHTLPPINEEIRWLKFTHTECMMYNAYLADPNHNKLDIFLRQLCCHPQLANETKNSLSNCKTLEDIEKMMIIHYKNQMDESQNIVNKIKTRITKIEYKIKEIEEKKNKDIDATDILDSDDEDNTMGNVRGMITLENLKERQKKRSSPASSDRSAAGARRARQLCKAGSGSSR